MKSLNEIKAEILAENPSRQYEINGEVFEMTDAEFDKAVTDKAQMVFQQNTELAELQAQRQALLDKLGITAEEAKLLLA